jgi:hypothetical protein
MSLLLTEGLKSHIIFPLKNTSMQILNVNAAGVLFADPLGSFKFLLPFIVWQNSISSDLFSRRDLFLIPRNVSRYIPSYSPHSLTL